MAHMLSGLFGASARAKANDAELEVLGQFRHLPRWVPDVDAVHQCLEAEVPFGTYRWNGLFKLPQEAFHYDTAARTKKPIDILEHLCLLLESTFPVTVDEIFCNRFVEDSHHIDWHQDQYGCHLFVMSFGADRTVEYRVHGSEAAAPSVHPQHGDLYYMHPRYDKQHDHRVLAGTGRRISLAIFASARK